MLMERGIRAIMQYFKFVPFLICFYPYYPVFVDTARHHMKLNIPIYLIYIHSELKKYCVHTIITHIFCLI